jgi:hypothetical protein
MHQNLRWELTIVLNQNLRASKSEDFCGHNPDPDVDISLQEFSNLSYESTAHRTLDQISYRSFVDTASCSKISAEYFHPACILYIKSGNKQLIAIQS